MHFIFFTIMIVHQSLLAVSSGAMFGRTGLPFYVLIFLFKEC